MLTQEKILYFDLIGGISGDMTVAALLDLGVSLDYLKHELKSINLGGYSLKKSFTQRGHVRAVKFDCLVKDDKNYSYREIVRLVNKSRLSKGVKENILKVYEALKDAEVKVHGHRHGDIRFKQLGEVDSIVDIAATCICLDKIAAFKIFFSAVPLSQKVSPATLELAEHKKVYFTQNLFENVTPTGMAILSGLGTQMDSLPLDIFSVGRCGYGAGSFDSPENPNVLRVVELAKGAPGPEYDEVFIVEANIDDMNPQFFEYIFDKCFEAGALDVCVENVIMKKSRPGFLLKVLSKCENLDKITNLVLTETTSLGVRFYPVRRLKVSREIGKIKYRGKEARVKLARLPAGGLRVIPEFEDCRRIARDDKIFISKVYNEIKRKAEDKWRSQD